MVAIGAGIQADILVGNKPDSDMLLLDVIRYRLALKLWAAWLKRSFLATPLFQ